MLAFSSSLDGLKYSLLAGPEYFTYMVTKLPNGRVKKLIMLGETHTPYHGCGDQGSCVTMTDYISKLGNEKCIDVFIEDALKTDQGYTQTDTTTYDGPRPDDTNTMVIMRNFLDKLSEDKRYRVHNWDLRSADNYGVNFIQLDDQIFDNPDSWRSFIKMDTSIYFKYFLGFKDVTDDDFKQLMNKTSFKVTKELLTQASILRQKIIKEYDKFEKTETEYFPTGKLPLRDLLFKYCTQKVRQDDRYMSMILTDFYAILRMFRTFGDKEKGSCIGEPYLDRIVYYAGSSHTRNIVEILRYYFPDSIKCQIISQSRQKIISFEIDMNINMGGYRSFSDFLDWPN